jgi:hypothetical protein
MEALHTETRAGFEIDFFALPEDTDPADHFDDTETIDGIARGRYDWFCAKVTASKAGVELAVEYLGCCCYDRARDFVTASGYYEDMRRSVIDQANETLARLNA